MRHETRLKGMQVVQPSSAVAERFTKQQGSSLEERREGGVMEEMNLLPVSGGMGVCLCVYNVTGKRVAVVEDYIETSNITS